MNTIKMNCDCGKVHEVQRDSDAPKNAVSMGCNWCPTCEDTADDYYNEWYNLIDNNDDDSDNKPILPEDVPDNQLMLFSIADDILENHVVVKCERSETVHINNYEITYMGKKCTIGDYVKYNKDLSKCKELEKMGALVYINSIVKNIDIPKKEFCFDVILEYLQFNMDKCNHLAIKVITDKKIKEVPDYLKDLFESNDEDEKYDLFVRLLSDCGVS